MADHKLPVTTSIVEAAKALKRGEVLIYPTESVYGLGADPSNEIAVQKILRLKNRSVDKGLILIADSHERFASYIQDVDEKLIEKAEKTWPGHTTWLWPAAEMCPAYLTGKYTTIAVRASAHKTVQQLSHAFNGPIVSTSCNQAGEPAAQSLEAVIEFQTHAKKLGIETLFLDFPLGMAQNPSEIFDLVSGTKLR